MKYQTSNLIFSVREMHELRDVPRLSPRVCVARLFMYKDQFGIKDISGEIWPITFAENSENLKSGDVIQFESCGVELSSPGLTTGSTDVFHITQILQLVANLEPWKHSIIPSPLENNSQERFKLLSARNEALERTKQFFARRGFFYVETPTLVPSGGMESYLNTFQTQYYDYHGRAWTFELPTSPEFSLKKIIAEGVPKVFQIARAFRNHGELSERHEPEFMMLEWYRVGSSLKDILDDTRKLVLTLAEHLCSKQEIPKDWKTFSVHELFLQLLNLDLINLQNTKDFYEASKALSLSIRETDTWDDIFCKLFMEKIEPFLKEQVACFVTGYPCQMSALAKEEEHNPLFVQRAEGYLFGIEISNGYHELVDSVEFEKRFQKTLELKMGHVRRDAFFENIMQFGLPPCAGNAVGIDRVIALLVGIDNIQKLIPIPFCIS